MVDRLRFDFCWSAIKKIIIVPYNKAFRVLLAKGFLSVVITVN